MRDEDGMGAAAHPCFPQDLRAKLFVIRAPPGLFFLVSLACSMLRA